MQPVNGPAGTPPARQPLSSFEPGLMQRGGLPQDMEDTIAGQIRIVFPTDSDWSSAFGIEAQWRRWVGPVFGFAVAAGYQSWKADPHEVILDPDYLIEPVLSGSLTAFPLGASILIRRPVEPGDRFQVSGELGFRYAFVDSDVSMTHEFDFRREHHVVRTAIDIDSRVLVVAAIEFGGPAGDHAEWFVAAGYQFDFESGETWLFEDVVNDLSGFQLGAGMRWKL
jgi:hypothetical protein